jgi:hypothetical protein
MKGYQRRWVFGVVAAAVAVVLVVVVPRQFGDGQKADCEKVHVLDSYNRWFQDGHAGAADKNEPNSIDEHRQWAAELHRYAGDIKDAELKAKAESLADLADHYVESVSKLRSHLPSATDNRPPSSRAWHEASRIGHQLNDAVYALADLCPIQ